MSSANCDVRTRIPNETTTVHSIPDPVVDEPGLDLEAEHTDGDRGWAGDVPEVRLSIPDLATLDRGNPLGRRRIVRGRIDRLDARSDTVLSVDRVELTFGSKENGIGSIPIRAAISTRTRCALRP